jgi:hypothetical protein
LVYVEHRPARGLGRGGGSTAGPQARLLWLDRGCQVLAVPWTARNFALNSVALGKGWAAGTEVLV